MIFDKDAKKYTLEKRQYLLTHAEKKVKVSPYFSLCIELNSKCISDLNIRPATLQLLEGKRIEYTSAYRHK